MPTTISNSTGDVSVSVSGTHAVDAAQQVLDGPQANRVTADLNLSDYGPDGILPSPAAGIAPSLITSLSFIATNDAPITITGGGDPYYVKANGIPYLLETSETFGVLAGQNATFRAGNSVLSIITAADNTSSHIVNDSKLGRMIAYTGIGGNTLTGEGLQNDFETAEGGSNSIEFNAQSRLFQYNNLTSSGQDLVRIDGSTLGRLQANAIVTEGDGKDSIYLNDGAALTFINLSSGNSTVSGSAGSQMTVSGIGSTTLLAGSGMETFNFVAAQAGTSVATDLIGNFNDQDTVYLTGYNAYTVNVVNGSTIITTSDNTRIVFAGLADASFVTRHIHAGT